MRAERIDEYSVILWRRIAEDWHRDYMLPEIFRRGDLPLFLVWFEVQN